MRGYTFIELLIVFSLMSIIGTVGVASFVNFSNSQALESAAADVASLATTARQRAISQIKPEQCTAAQTLSGYRILINNVANTYQMEAVCGSLILPVIRKKLPPHVSFDAGTPAFVIFNVPDATISSPTTIIINGFGKSKMVFVDSTGTISLR